MNTRDERNGRERDSRWLRSIKVGGENNIRSFGEEKWRRGREKRKRNRCDDRFLDRRDIPFKLAAR